MLNKVYIAVPFVIGLSLVACSARDIVLDNKKTELLGKDIGVFCDVSQITCTNIKEHQKMPIKIIPPLGLSTAVNQSEINCLARNITQEAVKGYIVDKIHVGYGTINRVKLGYGKTICQVIAGKNAMSWYKNQTKRNAQPSHENVVLAKKLLSGDIPNPSPNCMITNWYNVKLDSKNSFNANYMLKDGVCSKRPKNTPHFYMEVRL